MTRQLPGAPLGRRDLTAGWSDESTTRLPPGRIAHRTRLLGCPSVPGRPTQHNGAIRPLTPASPRFAGNPLPGPS